MSKEEKQLPYVRRIRKMQKLEGGGGEVKSCSKKRGGI